MGCNCGKARAAKRRAAKRASSSNNPMKELMSGYKYLKPHQVKARLEVYKKRHCVDCAKRYQCDYNMFVSCKVNVPKPA